MMRVMVLMYRRLKSVLCSEDKYITSSTNYRLGINA